MSRATPWKDRLSGALLALALQGAALSLFFFSLEVMRATAPEREIIVSFPRPVVRQEMPVTIIDARGAPPAHHPQTPAAQTPVTPSMPNESAPATNLPPPTGALPALGHALNDCTPEKLATLAPDQRAACPPVGSAPAGNDVLTSPYRPKDQKRWDDEMARKNGTLGPGTSSVTIMKDPICHLFLTLLNVHGFSCGPAPPAPVTVTDAQVKAALDAASKRHGINPPAVAQGPGDGK